MDEVVSDLPVEVSMVTEVSSETMELSNNRYTHTHNNV